MLFSAVSQFVFSTKDAVPLVQFIKGDISDKTAAVKRAGDDPVLTKKALDFVLENAEVLQKNDRDLAGLAVAALLSFPVEEYKSAPQGVIESFKKVFYSLDDVNVRISVFDKISAFYKIRNYSGSVDFVNEYLSNCISSKTPCDDTVKKAVEVLGAIGNGASFTPLYSILKTNTWQEIHPQVESALAAIADKSLNEIIDVVVQAELVELKLLFRIYGKNEENSATLRCEIAEKMLNRSMILVGKFSFSNDLAEFQLNCAKILSENKWTRAAELGKNYFGTAKTEYEKKIITETQFASAISYVESISSRGAVRIFSEYMDQMNKAQEAGNSPSNAVALAIINALGSLGDKSAFDCLLYVTYLDYSEDVTAAARNALTRLKW